MHWMCESFHFVRQADKRLINPLINNSGVHTKWHEETHYVNLYVEMSSSPKSGESPFLDRLIVEQKGEPNKTSKQGVIGCKHTDGRQNCMKGTRMKGTLK